MWQTDKEGGTGLKTNSSTIGGRASYAMSKHLKLLPRPATRRRSRTTAPTQKLAKLTLRPGAVHRPGVLEPAGAAPVRDTAKWNDAANAAAGAGGVTGIGDGKTKGTSYGAQVEMWF